MKNCIKNRIDTQDLISPPKRCNSSLAAALSGDVEVVRYIYDNYRSRSWLTAKTKDGETALSMALKEGHQEVVDFLRSIGATG